jgi:hypothetical protein
MTGNLKLILGAGSHSVALQWESTPGLAGSNWTLLNNAAVSGFNHGEELLVMITSENAQPTIAIGKKRTNDTVQVLSQLFSFFLNQL